MIMQNCYFTGSPSDCWRQAETSYRTSGQELLGWEQMTHAHVTDEKESTERQDEKQIKR